MTVVPASELGVTRLCKQPGCVNDATATRGRYAGLCDEHKTVAIQRQQRNPDPAENGGVSYEAMAKELVGVGKKIDAARSRHAGDRRRAEDSARAAAEALVEFKQAVRHLASMVGTGD